MKKIIALVLSLMALLSLVLPVAAEEVASGTCGDNLTWTLNDEGTLTISGTGDIYERHSWNVDKALVKEIVISAGVTSIGVHSFTDFEALTAVTFEADSKLTAIGGEAFMRCSNLTSISIPNGVTIIEPYTFNNCSNLTSVIIPEGVTSIGYAAFARCDSLVEIAIPKSVKNIEAYAFSFCDSLTSVTMPKGVNYSFPIAFNGCENLTSIKEYDDTETDSESITKELFSEDGTTLLAYYGEFGVTSYEVPANVTAIEYRAFDFAEEITEIVIHQNVTLIDDGAFFGCANLEAIKVNENNGYYCDIDGILFSKDKTKLIYYPDNKEGTKYLIPESVTEFGGLAFQCSNIEYLYYPGEFNQILYGNAGPAFGRVYYNYKFSEIFEPGTVIGAALRTDITAEINGHAIPSFNVDGITYIIAEDLKDYGFEVKYVDSARTLYVERLYTKTDVTRHYVKPQVNADEIGMKEYDILATDIITEIRGGVADYDESYNINGQTIVRFDALSKFADVTYDNEKRLISVTLPWVN